MAARRMLDGFLPSVNGFRFTNSFPREPTIRLDLGPAGTVGVGDASQGLCGGMAFAVRDYFEANVPIPELDTPPASDTPLFRYIVDRLLDSFNVPRGVLTYALWMLLPSDDVRLVFARRPGTFSRTVSESWPAVRADIDANHPSPLGLVTVHTSDLSRIGKCHQVLAYGYEVDDDQNVTLFVCDPNTPRARADEVIIAFRAAEPRRPTPITCNINITESTLHGFFRSAYSPKQPPASS
jgi:hypothetical protein